MDIEFRSFPKIPRGNPFEVTITEKINGTNGCIIIKDNKIAGVQSRNRLITPDDDNYKFAQWVSDNTEELLKLGEGYHYGEWAGPGIQKNPHQLNDKTFLLFNTFRWKDNLNGLPDGCSMVPILFEGTITPTTIHELLDYLKETYKYTDIVPEGLVVYYHLFRKYTKHTIENPMGKWNTEDTK